jgi:SAM-dependent methyltransferase
MTDRPDFGESRGPLRPRHAHDFDQFYEGTPPWEIGRPQPAFAALAESGALTGRVLDIGCGTGEHALLAAGLGLEATGVDAAPTAIARAEAKARERGLAARFLVADALALQALGEQFDTVVDCGLFHVFEDDDRARYLASLSAAVRPGGRYFVLCFSEHQPGDWGPRRVTQAEIRASFAGGWRVDSIDAARMDVTIDPAGVAAWLAALTRV